MNMSKKAPSAYATLVTRMTILKEMASQEQRNLEDIHVKADAILCEALEKLGARMLVEVYKTIPKWYC